MKNCLQKYAYKIFFSPPGLGFGVVVTLIPVFLNQYFVKHKASAIGIAFSGGSISSFVIPIAMEWLLENYNLKGSFLLLGGLVMNTLVASALLRPPPWLKKRKKASEKLLEDSEAKDSGVSTGDAANDPKGRIPSVTCLAIECEPHQEFDDPVFDESHPDVENDDSAAVDMSQLDPSSTEENASEKQDTVMSNNDSMLFEGSVTLYTGDTQKEHSKNSDKSDCGEIREPLMNGNHVYLIPQNKEPEEKKKKKRRFKISFHHSIAEILRNPMFHLITFTMFIFFVALQSFFVVIVDYAKDKGIPEAEGVYLMSIFSITDLVGRSGLGWITDRNYVKRKNMVIINLLVLSVINQLYPLIDDLSGLLAVAAFHGISAGSCITLFFVLQAEYLGMKRLTLVVGLTSFINGVLTLLRPAMIGNSLFFV